MGIENINRAKCDVCGQTEFSSLKQSSFLDELKKKGWTGSISKLKCSKCSGNKVYEGCIETIKKAGSSYYAKISNGKVDVYIRYQDLKPLGANELPTVEALKNYIRKSGKDPECIRYTNVKKTKIENHTMLLADVFGD